MRLIFNDDDVLFDPTTGELFDAFDGLAWAFNPGKTAQSDIINTVSADNEKYASSVNGLRVEAPHQTPISPGTTSLYGKGSSFVSATEPASLPPVRRPKAAGCRPDAIPGWTGPRGAPWYSRRKHDGYKVSLRTISDIDRHNLESATTYMIARGWEPNLHVALKPPTDHMPPIERMRLWPTFVQKFRVFCQNHKITCAMIVVRESDPETHMGEHVHWLCHVPARLHDDAVRLIEGWCPNAFAEPVKPDVEMIGSKASWIVGYLLKAAHPVSVRRDPTILYRRSGAVLGNRTFLTKNIDAKARKAWDVEQRAKLRIRREERTISSILRKGSKPPRPLIILDYRAGIVPDIGADHQAA